jgi:NitT/TauT family transport system ATP-binding protein
VTHGIDEALTLGDRVYVMSARPGRIIATVDVPFERPRDAAALRSDPRFGALYGEIWSVLRDEVARARTAELAEAGI